jgi:hypothetical protein
VWRARLSDLAIPRISNISDRSAQVICVSGPRHLFIRSGAFRALDLGVFGYRSDSHEREPSVLFDRRRVTEGNERECRRGEATFVQRADCAPDVRETVDNKTQFVLSNGLAPRRGHHQRVGPPGALPSRLMVTRRDERCGHDHKSTTRPRDSRGSDPHGLNRRHLTDLSSHHFASPKKRNRTVRTPRASPP